MKNFGLVLLLIVTSFVNHAYELDNSYVWGPLGMVWEKNNYGGARIFVSQDGYPSVGFVMENDSCSGFDSKPMVLKSIDFRVNDQNVAMIGQCVEAGMGMFAPANRRSAKIVVNEFKTSQEVTFNIDGRLVLQYSARFFTKSLNEYLG